MRALPYLARSGVLASNSRVDCGVGTGETAVDTKRLRDGRRNFGKSETHTSGFRVAGRKRDFRVRHQHTFSVNRNATYRMPRTRACSDEMQRLARQRPFDGDDLIPRRD